MVVGAADAANRPATSRAARARMPDLAAIAVG